MTDNALLEEIRRMKASASGLIAGGIITVAAGFLIFMISVIGFSSPSLLIFPMFFIGVIIVIIGTQKKKQLKEYVGEHVVRQVLSEYIELQSFDPNSYISKDIIRDMDILPSHNQRSGSDLIQGYYHGNPISLCDLLLQQVTSTGKTTTVVTVFRGQFLSYGLRKRLDGYVELQKRSAGKPGGILKRLKNFGSSVSHGRNFESVETENEAFNQTFDVRAENPLTAFLVLTPQFMERLMQVNEQVTTSFCFAEDTLYMAIRSNEDRFEVKGHFDTEEDIERFRSKIRYELEATLSLLDVLLANDNLF